VAKLGERIEIDQLSSFEMLKQHPRKFNAVLSLKVIKFIS
jgi:hypothetical protein